MMDPVGQFIEVVGLHFPTPKFSDASEKGAWVASWVRLLGHYEPVVLAKAADTIIRTRDRKKDGAFFPTPKEVIQVCEDAKRNLAIRSMPLLAGSRQPSGFDPSRHRLALDLMRTQIGEDAAKAGWHGQLYAFAYAHARLPSPAEAATLRANAQAFDRDLAVAESGKLEFQSARLAKLGRHIRQRRDKIKAAIAAE